MSDPNKKTSPTLTDGFHLHYFPNIPVDESSVDYGSRSPDCEFKRSLFEDLDPVSDADTFEYKRPYLGLVITKKLVGRLGGVIEVSSKLGKGTIVTVNLPFKKV